MKCGAIGRVNVKNTSSPVSGTEGLFGLVIQ